MNINTGFEFETQAVSMSLYNDKSEIYSPYEFYRKTLIENPQKIIQLYPDMFKKTTAFYQKILGPYISRNHRIVKFNDFKIVFDRNQQIQDFFSHAEFIITYPQNEVITEPTKQKVLNYLLNKAKDAVLDISSTLQTQFKRSERISDIQVDGKEKRSNGFPYGWIQTSKKEKIALLYNTNPSLLMSEFRFVAQTTLGVSITDTPKVMTWLTQAFIEAGGDKRYNIIPEVQEYVSYIMFKHKSDFETDSKTMRAFLFILFYSVMTTYNRKSYALFVSRYTMFDFALQVIGKDDMITLSLILLDEFFDDIHSREIIKIFKQNPNSIMMQKKRTQNLVDVSLLDYKPGMFLFEFRGFNFILKKKCNCKTNLYLNDVLVCKPF